jgi:hypothetical protein
MAYCVCFGSSPATNGKAVLAMADDDQSLIYFGIPLKRSELF